MGLFSYLLINYWNSSINYGIKALIYNKFGDICFLLVIVYCYNCNFYLNIDIISLLGSLSISSSSLGIISIIVIVCSKSAQIPFSS